ncbi:aconitase/3-isopropylmalate dehydratase large subunit family protein [Jiangella mangrovi]|uniref:3-isopropylmalate/(R)-2-methylmalate dehydratase large subunit n=1 Tax=Jiangella mangrovi TaxID=1524084 RepID=A0A7W9LKK8_9ACTN|nr:aconitase/3-isopropylmalate dehydratase large subunit family protein [Jiangella mangrovi]MBB5787243.1 3-isopropylmalate/(R)-2-methylmalate dehydratase large subunit [Jiangella mangrovi]
MAGLTMAHKVLAARSGRDHVRPGQLVVTDVDLIVMADTVFNPTADRMPTDLLRVSHPERVVVLMDHAVPAPSIKAATAHRRAREHAERLGFRRLADVGKGGIEHQLIFEECLALPGQLVASNDSHTSAAGVLNCAARGLGMADIIQLVCTGKTWYKVSPTVRFHLTGALPFGVYGKDVFLHLAEVFGSQEGHDVEFAGPGIEAMPLDDRATLATMCTELNANFVMMPADRLVREHVASVTGAPYEPVVSDPDAEYAAEHTVDLSAIRPRIALPDAMNGNVRSADEVAGQRVRIDQAFIGSCANGKLSDLRIAAEIVRGRRVADGVRLIVTPGSQSIYLDAVRLGYIEALASAGALVTNSTCGACAGGHLGVLAPGEVCITSSTRNFKGRMGSADARIYMGSSATVAASALEGCITDPMPYLRELQNREAAG